MVVKKTEKIEFRVTKKEKNIIKRRADKIDKSISEYVRDEIISRKNNKNIVDLDRIVMIKTLVLATDLVRYIEDRYVVQDDEELVRKVDEMWELLR